MGEDETRIETGEGTFVGVLEAGCFCHRGWIERIGLWWVCAGSEARVQRIPRARSNSGASANTQVCEREKPAPARLDEYDGGVAVEPRPDYLRPSIKAVSRLFPPPPRRPKFLSAPASQQRVQGGRAQFDASNYRGIRSGRCYVKGDITGGAMVLRTTTTLLQGVA